MAEFQAGNYAKAATDLEALVARVEVTPQVEPIFYTIGSAYFNAGDYPKAIVAFKNYQAKFPKGATRAAAPPSPSPSRICSARISRMRRRRWRRWRTIPQLREQALLFEAEALKAAGKTDDAIRTLEKLAGQEIRTPDAMRGATTLAQLYAQKGDGAKALRTLEAIQQKIALVDNIIELNALTVELGDKFYEKQQFKEALACYRFACPREQIIRLQNDRIAGMQHRIEENLAAIRANPTQITQLAPANNQLKASIANAQKLLAEFEKLPSITPAIYLRLGRCFYELDRKWEAVVVNQEILDRFKEGPEREPALFGLIVALADVNQPQRAEERCEQYLRDFKNGPNAATVGYLLGAVALQAGDPKAAETYFSRILETQPKSQFREQIRYLFGNAKFMAGSYDEAVTAYKKYLSEFPKGASAEDVKYRIALCALFAGKYQDAMNQLQDYVAKHPSGSFPARREIPARRLQICRLALRRSDRRLPGVGKTISEQPATRRSARAPRRRLRRERSRGRRHPGLHPLLSDRDDRRSDELFALRREQAPAKTERMGQSRRAFQRLRQRQTGQSDRRFGALLDRQSESARRQDRRSQTTRRRHDQEIHRRSEPRRGRAIDHATRAALREEKARWRRTLTPAPAGRDFRSSRGHRPRLQRATRARSSIACSPLRPTKNPPPPKRAFFSPRPSSPGSGVNRLRRKKISRRSQASLSRKT